ncbi:MAG: phenylalanine--tRNA ligase subunit beta [Candidatus Bathyarchaeia archaeon]
MPVIRVGLKDFERLVGLTLSLTRLRNELPMIGLGWERDDSEGFEVEIFPNRPDMLSPEGLARAYRGFLGLSKGAPHYVVNSSFFNVYVDRAVCEVRPCSVFAVVKNIPMDEEVLKSIIQLQEKLHVSYCRNRRKASIGVHDLDKFKPPVRYTVKASDFKFRPLDHSREMTLKEILENHPKGLEYGYILAGFDRYPIIEDSQGLVLSMPPIINSDYTKVDTNTRNIFIDCTGLDWKIVNSVLNIIVTSLAERGGEIYKVKVLYPVETPFGKVFESPDLKIQEVKLSLDFVNKILGEKLTISEVLEFLHKMRYDATEYSEEEVLVKVPAYRVDIMHPVDLVEDVAIAYRYDHIKPEIPKVFTRGGESYMERFSAKVRLVMVGLGFQEVITDVLTNPYELFTAMRVKPEPVVELENPKTIEYTVCRNWLMPCLMKILSRNRHREYPQRIFEVDDVVILDENSETGAINVRKLAAVSIHSEADYAEIKAVVDTLLKILDVKFYIKPGEHPSFIEGRIGFIEATTGENLGFLGEIHPEVLENFGLENPSAGFEINLMSIVRLKGFGQKP